MMATDRRRPQQSLPLPSLSTLKTSLELLSNLGSSAPFLQATVDTAAQIIRYAEEVKRNRKDALELARSVADIVQALVDATRWLEDDEIDERFKADIYEFHQRLVDIAGTMQRLTLKTVWRRFLHKDSDAEAIVTHRRALDHATAVFHIKDGMSKRVIAAKRHEEVMGSLRTLAASLSDNSSTYILPIRRESEHASVARRLSSPPIVLRRSMRGVPRIAVDLSVAM
ncbi:hypothetical protein C8Q74DRAFT_730267 [Fomes fomentarius]|nr:hypothetical protein C8Q74DRAFT_730267 [Fomes fomentarius]